MPSRTTSARSGDRSTAPSKGKLNVGEDFAHAHRDWQIQKVAWVVWAAILIAGLVGWLGSGPFSNAVAGDKESALWIEYERFGRRRGPTNLVVHARTPVPGKLRVRMNTPYLHSLEIERITPEPRTVEAAGEQTIFEFVASAGHSTIVFDVQPKRTGRLDGRMGVEGGPDINFTQLIYP